MEGGRIKALGVESTGPAENLKKVTISRPVLKPRDILVRILAVSVNPICFKVRSRDDPSINAQNPKVISYKHLCLLSTTISYSNIFIPMNIRMKPLK